MTRPSTIPSERAEQKALAYWLRAHGILSCHVPNENAHRLHALGVEPGVPDVLVFDEPRVAIELKRRDGGVLSEAQKRWLMALSDRGWHVFVCRGAGEAVEQLRRLGYGNA